MTPLEPVIGGPPGRYVDSRGGVQIDVSFIRDRIVSCVLGPHDDRHLQLPLGVCWLYVRSVQCVPNGDYLPPEARSTDLAARLGRVTVRVNVDEMIMQPVLALMDLWYAAQRLVESPLISALGRACEGLAERVAHGPASGEVAMLRAAIADLQAAQKAEAARTDETLLDIGLRRSPTARWTVNEGDYVFLRRSSPGAGAAPIEVRLVVLEASVHKTAPVYEWR